MVTLHFVKETLKIKTPVGSAFGTVDFGEIIYKENHTTLVPCKYLYFFRRGFFPKDLFF